MSVYESLDKKGKSPNLDSLRAFTGFNPAFFMMGHYLNKQITEI